jgi:hypothetical protein
LKKNGRVTYLTTSDGLPWLRWNLPGGFMNILAAMKREEKKLQKAARQATEPTEWSTSSG